MNRRVPQSIDTMNFNSAKLSVKLCETLRDILFLLFSQPRKGRGVRLTCRQVGSPQLAAEPESIACSGVNTNLLVKSYFIIF